jgi:hypothetical protein
MMSIAFSYCFAECHYAECRCAECRYDECRGAGNSRLHKGWS